MHEVQKYAVRELRPGMYGKSAKSQRRAGLWPCEHAAELTQRVGGARLTRRWLVVLLAGVRGGCSGC